MNRPILRLIPLVALLVLAACSSPPLPEPDLEAIADSVLVLETAMHAGIDGLDCEAGMRHFGDREPAIVGGGQVFRTTPEARALCDAIVAGRDGAELDPHHVNVHALSEDVVYVVREGDYTVYPKGGGDAESTFIVFTSIWHRADRGWQMVHLHESWPMQEPEAG